MLDGVRRRLRLAIWRRREQRVVGIADRGARAVQTDLIAAQPPRIAAAVLALVVKQCQFPEFRRQAGGDVEDVRGELDVPLQRLALLRR